VCGRVDRKGDTTLHCLSYHFSIAYGGLTVNREEECVRKGGMLYTCTCMQHS
jgi:hypothetical protein